MRADTLEKIIPSSTWERFDTDEVFLSGGRFWKSMAFRFKAGPLVSEINKRLLSQSANQQVDLTWVDKGIYLWPETVKILRKNAERMVHYTPDTAFLGNRSRHFNASLDCYDLLVTTKSFELEHYQQLVQPERLMLVTQAYDARMHQPPLKVVAKEPVAVFIGLCEPDRERCMHTLLAAGIPVRLGGRGWGNFIRNNAGHPNLCFLGQDIFGEDYVGEYTRASVGLGLLSKRFPELHTTRTLEIPACGTLLATERTADTSRLFDEDEALFFRNYGELALSLKKLLLEPDQIESMAQKGHQRIIRGAYDYQSVLSGVLERLPAQ